MLQLGCIYSLSRGLCVAQQVLVVPATMQSDRFPSDQK